MTPSTRPSLGNVNRPSISAPGIATRPAPGLTPGGSRPGIADRPGIGGDRPTTLPARPGPGDRPGIGGRPDRPGIGGDRPGPGDRPIIGNRPGPGDRPIIGNRPGPGNRPIIGGGNNNIVNRPGGDNNFINIGNRPGWGLGGPGHGNWTDHWYDHHVPPYHHGWYHGCWSGHWGNYWYAPIVAGATAWGLNALLPSWGYAYGYAYENPYYVASPQPIYDYSQPIALSTYEEPAPDAAPPAESPETTEANQLFSQALAAFATGNYQGAEQLVQQALRKTPQDPAMHEVRALCLFATGDYNGAAAVLNNLLAVAPGMDWTTLIGLYGNAEAYTAQLRSLEARCRQNPADAAANFVLAYHYLVAGHSDAATEALKRVVASQPGDQVARRMLAALTPPAQPAPEPGTAEQPATAPAAAAAPSTDLVGAWRAERNGDVFELVVGENSQFNWKATPKGKPAITLNGTMAATGDAILLESKSQGTMAAKVTSGGPDQFQFVAAGSPPDDKGLTFQRAQQATQ